MPGNRETMTDRVFRFVIENPGQTATFIANALKLKGGTVSSILYKNCLRENLDEQPRMIRVEEPFNGPYRYHWNDAYKGYMPIVLAKAKGKAKRANNEPKALTLWERLG